jgi:hypothetical protein
MVGSGSQRNVAERISPEGFFVANVNETPRIIAKLLDVPVALLVEHNATRYAGIAASSKLKRDTWYAVMCAATHQTLCCGRCCKCSVLSFISSVVRAVACLPH